MVTAAAAIGGTTLTFSTGTDAIATATGGPAAASTTAVLNANAAIKSAFATDPSYFALGELGGAYTSGGTGTETTTSGVTLTVDLTQLSTCEDLAIGLYDGTALGSGFESLTFTVTGDNETLLTTTFTSPGAATTFLANDAIDLGSLASRSLSGGSLNLATSLSVTTDASGQGFDAGFLIGNPAAGTVSGPHQLSTSAGFGAALAGHSGVAPVEGRECRDGWHLAGSPLHHRLR